MAHRRHVAAGERHVVKMMRRFLLASAVCFPLTACGLSSPGVSGRIVEEGTGKPVPGATVLVRWEGYVAAPGHAHPVCVHAMSATTDDQGRYHVEAWSKASKMGPITGLHTIIVSYKPGYEFAHQAHVADGVQYLAAAAVGEDERAAFLLRVLGNSRCYTKDVSQRNALPWLDAVQNEALTLTGTKMRSTLVDAIRDEREIIELGPEEAQRRYLERANKEAK